MFSRLTGILALAIVSSSAFAVVSARAIPPNLQINEILMNPAGSGDANQGREFIELYGLGANQSLDGYAIVILENEEDGSFNNDRGRVKNIFKIPNGKSTDGNGLFVIRDLNGSGSPATFSPSDPLGANNRWDVQFQTIVSAVPVRGNTFENEGMNIFLVKNVNNSLVQKQEDGSGNKVVDGTDLDTNDDGVLDYYADDDGDRIINGEDGGGQLKPWDSIEDFMFVGEGDYESDEGVSNKPERNINYILALLPGGNSPAPDYMGSYVICDIQLGVNDSDSWTPDIVARVGHFLAVVADVSASGDAQNFDADERSFSAKFYNALSVNEGTLRATPGRVAEWSVQDRFGVVWSH